MAGFVHIWVKTTQHFLECMEKMNVILVLHKSSEMFKKIVLKPKTFKMWF